MYIQVRLLRGYQKPLWYHISPKLHAAPVMGSIVHVPLRNKIMSAIVVLMQPVKPDVEFAIKEIFQTSSLPADIYYAAFIKQLANYYALDPVCFFKRVSPFIKTKVAIDQDNSSSVINGELDQACVGQACVGQAGECQVCKNKACAKQVDANNQVSKNIDTAIDLKKEIQLTQEQQVITDFLKPRISQSMYTPTLLHGVTASGKTEVYKQLIMHAYAENKTTLLLLPEVTLAQSFENRLRAELKNSLPIYGFHSGSTQKNKLELWQQLLAKKPILIIGVHLPLFLPIAHLGLIIVDEEHEVGYQEKKHPKLNSKDAAIMRAHVSSIPILLGSATPSLSSLYNTKKRGWHFFQLKNRFSSRFPSVRVVSLADKKDRKNFWISQPLYDGIKDRLHKKEQSIVFINRRGFSFFIQCKNCNFIVKCTTCSVSLTLHEKGVLSCHYCGFSMQQPTICQSCKKSDFLKKGIGTQQIVSILETLFPSARIARADMDVTVKKKIWQKTLEQFMNGDIDILVGTQTITKGYDFSRVTLVGVLWADLNLHMPFYNAAETTLQQLIQVAGRAGRQTQNNSEVIVQTMKDFALFGYLNEIDYLSFYKSELEKRELLHYPPVWRLVEIELKSESESVVEKESDELVQELVLIQKKIYPNLIILGPAQPMVYKIKNVYLRKIYIKGESMQEILSLFKAIDTKCYSSAIYFTPNPVT